MSESEVLYGRARDDLSMARALFDAGQPAWGVAFHAQQAVEKALKAIIAHDGREFPYTHDLAQLQALLPTEAQCGAVEGLSRLTEYAVAGRYGGEAPTLAQAQAALQVAGMVVESAVEDLR